MMKKIFYSLMLLLIGIATQAQITTANLTGFINDGDGKPLPNATLRLMNKLTNDKYASKSNSKGYYSFENMAVGGPYTLTISCVGCKEEMVDDIYLQLGDNSTDVNMKSETKKIKEVTISGGKKKNDNAAISMDANRMKVLPTISRNITDMTRLTPQSANNSFLGTNYRYNNVTIDGSISNDAIGFSPSLGGQSGTSGMPGSSTRTSTMSLDAIQDLQVYLSPYDVKIGNFLGGSINAVTRSGTNKLTGSAYLFGRNGGLTGPNNAGDGSNIPTSFSEVQVGARVGLPIIKDKLFFFTNEEYTRRVDPVFFAAGDKGATSATTSLVDVATASAISNFMNTKYGFDAGAYGKYDIYSEGFKLFNRFDWHINDNHKLTLRNNTTISKATNLERDASNFRFGSMDFTQYNIQVGTVAELKSKFSDRINNNFVLGFTNIHDWRDPSSSNPNMPQIEIAYNGGTIFLGNDREATVFNMLQRSWEITDNLTISVGKERKHNVTIGTHEELYHIDYGFVNSLNGRVSYSSLANFYNSAPSRVRGFYANDATQNNRAYQWTNPYAKFDVNLYSLYVQDEWQVNQKLRFNYGLRADMASIPSKPAISTQQANTPADRNYGSSFTHTPLAQVNNNFLGQILLSPRIGFNYDVLGNKSLIVKGGSGIFTGRVPFAWLGYAFYNDGIGYGSYDVSSGIKGDPLTGASAVGIASTSTRQVQVDAINNDFQLPQVWRSNLGVDYTINGYKLSLEGIYTKVVKDLVFQQVNFPDTFTYMQYDANREMPYYLTNGSQGSKLNSGISNAYLLSNTDQGYRYSITGSISKFYKFGLNFSVAYTYGESKDLVNGIRNSMESNWQLNPALSPNNPKLSYSNFDIRHRIVSTVGYKHKWNDKNTTTFTVVFTAQSGNPYTWGFQNTKINNSPVNSGLAYIFNDATEAAKYMVDYKDASGQTVTAATQAQQFMDFVNNDSYLSTRKGQWTERNGARTPWNVNADLRIMHDYKLENGHSIQLSFDIINLTNLINSDWGWQYFAPNTFNSTASVGLSQTKVNFVNGIAVPQYTYKAPASSYSIDQFASRWQMQLGLRYSF